MLIILEYKYSTDIIPGQGTAFTSFPCIKSCKNEHLSDRMFPEIYITFILQLHASIDDLKEAVNPKILPKEYGGEVPLADMIGEFFLPQ